jgi:hypothetical protein
MIIASKSQPRWLYESNHCISLIHRLPSWILTSTSNVPPTPYPKMMLNPTSASFKPISRLFSQQNDYFTDYLFHHTPLAPAIKASNTRGDIVWWRKELWVEDSTGKSSAAGPFWND